MKKLLWLVLFACGGAQAQTYPSKPVRIVVPYTTGGAPDILARLIGDELNKALHAPFIVENKGGQGGSVGADTVAKSAPDGYTLLVTTTATQSINQFLYPKLGHDPIRDLMGVALIAYTPVVLAVANDVPAKSLQELIAYGKANPGKLTFASAGSGTLQHISGELMKSLTGVDMVHIPYKGTGQLTPDLISGRVSMMFNSVAPFAGFIKDGKLRALAVTRKTQALPGVPTFTEAGLAGFDVSPWYAAFAPAGMPPETLARLNTEINRIVARPDIGERLLKLGLEPASLPAAELDALVRRDADKWGKIIRDKQIRAD
jgi:tripartite-type tricarboxylate transporter receptor subunit TctC